MEYNERFVFVGFFFRLESRKHVGTVRVSIKTKCIFFCIVLDFFCSTLSEFKNFLSHNLSKRNVKLILKVLSDLEPLRGSSNKKTLYSTRGPLKRSFHSRFKMAHACQKGPNLHTNSSNKLLLGAMKPNKKLQHWEKFIIFNSSKYHSKKISECKVKTMCPFCNELTISVGLIRAGRNIRENNFLLRIFDPQFRVFCQQKK
jgi:hypothetical protein